MSALLELSGVIKRYGNNAAAAVQDVSFHLDPGEILALLGPSGSGKSTLLRLIAGFEHVEAGNIRLRGTKVASADTHLPPEHRGIGLVFQDYALFPHLTVLENVAYGLREGTRTARHEAARAVLERVGLEGMADRRPQELSGGEQQRVALARSLAPNPLVVLLDEPFSSLDADLRQGMRADVRALWKRDGVSGILVTHDQEEAFSFADRVVVLDAGRVVQVGTPEELCFAPASEFVARFLGETNLLVGEANGETATTDLGEVRLDRAASGQVTVCLRREDLRLAPAGAGAGAGTMLAIPGTVEARVFRGRDALYRVTVAGERVLHVRMDSRCPLREGDAVSVELTQSAVLING